MKETKFKQTLVQTKDERRKTKEGSRHCEERSDVAIQSGFKMTEVGMIPNNWEIKPLKDIAGLKAGKMTSYNDFNPKYPCFGGNGIRAYLSHYSHDGIYPIIGRQGELCGNVNLAKGKFYATEHAVVASPKKDIDAIWLYYQLTALNLNQYATGCAQPGLSVEKVNDVYTQVPPTIEEQQRIANALSDVDTLIANLEKLIAKKKNIKQGAMQQLLIGKKRLPGFGSDERQKECHSERSAKREVEESSGYKMTELGMIPSDWEVKPIKELGLFLGGGTPSTKNESFWKGNIPWISSADLNDDDIEHISMTRFITQEAVNFSATQICPQGTILIIARVGVGKLALSQQKVCTSQDFCNLIPSKENDSKFLAYALLPVMKRMSNESQGTSIKGVAVDEIKKVQIIVPSSKAEQTAIANVLSDMDTEISALETKLAKYRTLKTGMMQQLLTGKIRLVK